ncbi:Uncharacterised protein [Candidatus Venteria ishoeyi]|uniref:Uncharacterized protein n=2 Tax=Candidatus Venteria ishoeyi TaxID=1899563 RepID=A0A1H6F5I5_9GAMM|nr:Uncharacterised protein [Candidatus Venteria ishoeyi]
MPAQAVKNGPPAVISDKVRAALWTRQRRMSLPEGIASAPPGKVPVLIKLREAGDNPYRRRMANARNTKNFVSKGKIKSLQAKLKASFSSKERNEGLNINFLIRE